MANNEERFCNHCGKETLFVLQSDSIWYCDECEYPFGSLPLMNKNSNEYKETMSLFEEENGEAVYCSSCGNFVAICDVLEDSLCPVCGDEISEIQMNEKGYFLNDEMEWIKDKE